ncbi:hypothetical protein B0I35DRAFT_343 [Stachybotrys elegans]|uniref:Fungal N-terminal domain-containing protein n=1 Tax=Stachybotrys elegans TaxID=80388 RepID=A0A8K0T0P8_9HYPO|nr:hypothetical protein B0I35DRAFT_343 [Stachybotrys elegans]
MEPVTAVGLAHICVSLAATTVKTVKMISDLRERLQDVNQNIRMLASQMDLISLVLSELKTWLNRSPSISHSAQSKLASAIQSCGVIVTDIAASVQAVLPPSWESEPNMKQRMSHLWKEQLIREQREMINTSLQAFQLIFSMTALVDRGMGDLETFLETSRVEAVIEESARDAVSIRAARDNESIYSSFTARIDNTEGTIPLDEQLSRSGPYRNQSRPTPYNAAARQPFRSPIPEGTADHPMATNNGGPHHSFRSTLSSTSQDSGGIDIAQSPSNQALLELGAQGRYSVPPSQRLVNIEDIDPTDIENVRRKVSRISLNGVKWHVSVKALNRVNDLCWHIKIGNMEGIRKSLLAGAYINGYDTENGLTPLMTAIIHRQLGLADFLLKLGADVRLGFRLPKGNEATDRLECESMAPIHKAAELGFSDAIRLLFKYRADVNDAGAVRHDKDKRFTPLCFASGDAAQQLIELGANLSQKLWNGSTPLYWAAVRGDCATMECLLRNGAEVNIFVHEPAAGPGRIWETSLLHEALKPKHALEMAKLLLHYGADPNLKLRDGNNSPGSALAVMIREMRHHHRPRMGLFHPIDFPRSFVEAVRILVNDEAIVTQEDWSNVAFGLFSTSHFEERKQILRILCNANPELLDFKPFFDDFQCSYRKYKVTNIYVTDTTEIGILTDSVIKNDEKIKENVLIVFRRLADLTSTLIEGRTELLDKMNLTMEPSSNTYGDLRPEAKLMQRDATVTVLGKWTRASRIMNRIGDRLNSALADYLREHGANAYAVLFLDAPQSESPAEAAGINDAPTITRQESGMMLNKTAQALAEEAIQEVLAEEAQAERDKEERIRKLADCIRLARELNEKAKAANEIAVKAKADADAAELAQALEMIGDRLDGVH